MIDEPVPTTPEMVPARRPTERTKRKFKPVLRDAGAAAVDADREHWPSNRETAAAGVAEVYIHRANCVSILLAHSIGARALDQCSGDLPLSGALRD
jgi:hypothetical protein